MSVVAKWDGSGTPLAEDDAQYHGIAALVSALPGVDARVRRRMIPYIASWRSKSTVGHALEKEITIAALSSLLGRLKGVLDKSILYPLFYFLLGTSAFHTKKK